LWAGPLCTRLLADRGARVVKVESAGRPDGARAGPNAFFERMHACKEVLTLDLRGPELRELLADCDVVVEGSRPRALLQLGIRAEELAPRVWLSITGYGRDSNRVAFGDDAAVAGGLVAFDADGPCFVADAVADPLTGVASAAAVVAALEQGGRWLLDASMAGVAAFVAGDDAARLWSTGPRGAERGGGP
jgi:crotonobetainyl-CoA:carnitine CoA-transferase CaiB-like acyl-CoA transferase